MCLILTKGATLRINKLRWDDQSYKENNHSGQCLDLGKYLIGIPVNDKFSYLSSQGWKTRTLVTNKDCARSLDTREVTNTSALNFFPSKPQGELNSLPELLNASC